MSCPGYFYVLWGWSEFDSFCVARQETKPTVVREAEMVMVSTQFVIYSSSDDVDESRHTPASSPRRPLTLTTSMILLKKSPLYCPSCASFIVNN